MVVAVVAMLAALAFMSAGRLGVAGGLFLGASIVIYLREQWA